MNDILGPVAESLLLSGEKVAVRTRRVLSWKGRCVVRVQVLGSGSIWGGWILLSFWGACVEAYICHGGNVKHLIDSLYPGVYVAPLDHTLRMPPHHSGDGVLAGTISSEEELDHFSQLIRSWAPSIVLATFHHHFPRRFQQRLQLKKLRYHHTTSVE